MVVLQVKQTDNDQFLFETTCQTDVTTLIQQLCEVYNLRLRIQAAADAAKELAKHGAMKPVDKQGIDSIQQEAGQVIEKGPNYLEDPLGVRNGNGPDQQLKETLNRVSQEAMDAVSSKLVNQKVPLTVATLQTKLDHIQGAVTMAYPMGLPSHDILVPLLKDQESSREALQGTSSAQCWMGEDTAQLWWAGREFLRGEKVSSRVGKNEKTKIVVRLQDSSRVKGAPQREPAVSEEERKTMMAHYFKKQQELKEIAEAGDDDFHNSVWADPATLKNNLRGTNNIRPF